MKEWPASHLIHKTGTTKTIQRPTHGFRPFLLPHATHAQIAKQITKSPVQKNLLLLFLLLPAATGQFLRCSILRSLCRCSQLDRTRNGWVTRRRRRVVADLVGGLGLHGFHVLEGHGPGRESGAGDRRGTAVWVPEKAEKPSELISLGQQENKRRHVCNGQLCHWPLSKISVFATTRGVPI